MKFVPSRLLTAIAALALALSASLSSAQVQTVSNLTASPSLATENAPTILSVDYTSSGESAFNSVQFYASLDNTLSTASDPLVGTIVVPITTGTVQFETTFNPTPAGLYTVFATVSGDQGDSVTSAPLLVNQAVDTSSVIDLSGAFGRKGPKPNKKGKVTASVRVRLATTDRRTSVPAYSVQFYRSPDTVIDLGDALLGTANVKASKRPYRQKTARVKATNVLNATGNTLFALIDSSFVVGETVENNNLTSTTLR